MVGSLLSSPLQRLISLRPLLSITSCVVRQFGHKMDTSLILLIATIHCDQYEHLQKLFFAQGDSCLAHGCTVPVLSHPLLVKVHLSYIVKVNVKVTFRILLGSGNALLMATVPIYICSVAPPSGASWIQTLS